MLDFFWDVAIIASNMANPMVSLYVPVFPHFYVEGVVSTARPGSSPGFGTINKNRGLAQLMG
jgi:hypothetical protein